MARRTPILAGLDIGTSNVKVVIAEPRGEGKVDITGVGIAPSRGLRKGVVINIEATVSSISAAVSQAEAMAGREISAVTATISGAHIKGFNSHGIVGIKNKEVSRTDIEKVIEAAKAVAIPLDREVLHVLPQEFIIDEQDGIKEPLGISGVRLEARVHILTGAIASSQNIVKCANRCGLQVDDIIPAALASGRSVLTPEEEELGVCLLDIGGGTTDLTVFRGAGIRRTSVIPIGGNHITNDIAAGLRAPLAAAEEVKKTHGVALAEIAKSDETFEVASTGGRPSRTISRRELAEIIEPRVFELLSLVQKELRQLEPEDFPTSGIVLSGGTANLPGICQAAEKFIDVPVRVGQVQGVGGLTDLVRDSEYAASVGLVLFGLEAQHSGKVTHGGPVVRVFKRAANWVGRHF